MSVRRVSVAHKLLYNIVDKLYAVSPGFVPSFFSSRSHRSSVSLTRSRHHRRRLLLQLVSGILRFHKTSLFTAYAFFLVIVRLRSFCSYDSPRPSSSMKLSPARRCPSRPLALCSFLPVSLIHPLQTVLHSFFSLSLRHALFPPIPLHPYCRCNPRHSAELSLLASTFSGRRSVAIVATLVTLSNSAKTYSSMLPPSLGASPFSSSTRRPLPHTRNGYNSAEHLLPFHFSPFFRFAPPSAVLHRKQFVPLTDLFLATRIKFYNVPEDTRATLRARRVIIFSGPSRYINRKVLRETRIISRFT